MYTFLLEAYTLVTHSLSLSSIAQFQILLSILTLPVPSCSIADPNKGITSHSVNFLFFRSNFNWNCCNFT
ncbi:hypothetical protein HanHA300_Chr10g0366061 [Helianthus annuus]|nr:hypothetical protein HanHA300_Chr10g0366061 [Helianthus annuus]KAJ0697134.1 hypothetical protein HanLR1_Chr10g0365311 [Helianthus annuus]